MLTKPKSKKISTFIFLQPTRRVCLRVLFKNRAHFLQSGHFVISSIEIPRIVDLKKFIERFFTYKYQIMNYRIRGLRNGLPLHHLLAMEY